MAETNLFTYGLLMRGMRYHDSHLAGHAKGPTLAEAEGLLVYLQGPDIPAMLAGEGLVKGELYQIDDSMLPHLDYLFGVVAGKPERSEYVRRRIAVNCENGESEAWGYFMRGATRRKRFPDAVFIEDGDWRRLNQELEPSRQAEKSKLDPLD